MQLHGSVPAPFIMTGHMIQAQKMKKLEIIIPDRHLKEVNDLLKAANVGGMSYYRIEGRGKFKPSSISVGRGTKHYTPEFIPRLKVEVIVTDNQVQDLINRLLESLGGQSPGGKVFVTDIPLAADLTTKQVGESAI